MNDTLRPSSAGLETTDQSVQAPRYLSPLPDCLSTHADGLNGKFPAATYREGKAGLDLLMDAHGRVEPDSRDEPLSCGPAQGWPESREGEAVPPAGGTPGIPSGLFRMEGKEV